MLCVHVCFVTECFRAICYRGGYLYNIILYYDMAYTKENCSRKIAINQVASIFKLEFLFGVFEDFFGTFLPKIILLLVNFFGKNIHMRTNFCQMPAVNGDYGGRK